MIKTKEDLKYYLECDRIARDEKKTRPSLIGDRLWKLQIKLRKCEFYHNNREKILYKLMYIFSYRLYLTACKRLCSEIPLNVFAEGLVIWHGQNIIINDTVKVGRNFSISSGCCIGQGNNAVPVIGNNVEMTIGSKVIGGIHICNDVTIGAGAVVVKNITEPFTTWGGIPARCISRKENAYVQEKKNRLQGILHQNEH